MKKVKICAIRIMKCNSIRQFLLLGGAALILLLSSACKAGQSKGAGDNSSEPVLDRAAQAFLLIPDHACVSAEAAQFMTPDLYDALLSAWNVPRWCDGEIGGEEFLFYFVTGNGGGRVGQVKSVSCISASDSYQSIELTYSMVPREDEPATDTWSDKYIGLTMVKTGGLWMLDDFGIWSDAGEPKDAQFFIGRKAACLDYIKTEVDNYLSGKTCRYMKSMQTDDWYTDDHINKVIQAFSDFLHE